MFHVFLCEKRLNSCYIDLINVFHVDTHLIEKVIGKISNPLVSIALTQWTLENKNNFILEHS